MNARYTILNSVLLSFIIGSTIFPAYSNDELSNQDDDNSLVYENTLDSTVASMHPSLIVVKEDPILLSESQAAETSPFPITRGSSHIPKTFEIDTTKEIGEIPIISGSTQSGAKTYDVPIEIYPGINGFQPALALSYNSQKGNSFTGKGWNLSGISSIRRTVKNPYYDGRSEGIRMNRNDAFTLDGVRLIMTDDSDTSCIQYESESGNIKARAYCSEETHNYFEVFYPNGEKGTFGYRNSSDQELEYPLTTMTDLDGNKIEYKYDHSVGHYRITGISYNGCSVEFSYINRTDRIMMFSGGMKINEFELLEKITVKYGSVPIREYKLSYTYESGTALLSNITCSCGSKSLNPLKFLYGDDAVITEGFETSATKLYEYYKPENINQLKAIRGRINYELCEDGVLVYPNKTPYWRYAENGEKYDVYISKYPEDEKIFVYNDLKGEYDLPMPSLITGKGFIDILCANLDGRMEESVVKINNYVSDEKDIIEFSVYKMAFGSLLAKAYTRTYEWGTAHKDRSGRYSVYPKLFHTGDFNGDGRTEILVTSTRDPFGGDSGISTCVIIDLESDRSIFKENFLSYFHEFIGGLQSDARSALNKSDRFLPIDFDGDGKTDICHINNDGINIYTFDADETGLTARKISTDNILTRGALFYRDIFITDLNGDGLMDIVRSPRVDGDNDWHMYYSTGIGTFERKDFLGPYYSTNDNGGVMFQDINGDGYADMIRYDNHGFSVFIEKDDKYGSTPSYTLNAEKVLLIPVNINSSSRSTQLISLKDGIATKHSYFENNRTSTLLRGMVNSLGIVEINDYGQLNESRSSSELYTKGYSSSFPYIDILEPISVISSSETYLNGEMTDRKEFKYSEGVFHTQGLGFCGFKEIHKINKRGHSETESFDPYNYAIMKSHRTPYSETSYTFNVNVQPNKSVKITPVSKTEKDLLKGFSSTTDFVCDSYGYPTKETTVYSNGTRVELQNTYRSNPTIGDGYHIGLKTGYEKKIIHNGSTYTEKLSTPAYRNRRPLLEILTKNGNTVGATEYAYDTKGNLITKTVKPYRSTVGKRTSYTYDGFGRKLTETNYLGLKEYYSYDANGCLKSIKDHRGAETSFSYDAFGREISISYPDTTVRHIQYAWNSNIPTALYSIIETKDGEPTVKKHFDALNREVRSSESGLGGITKSIDRIYNEYGELWKVSEPFTGSSASLWNVYEYDWYGRPNTIREASGTEVSYSYGSKANTVTTNDGKETVVRKHDIFGNLISLSDTSGTVTYEMTPDGLLSSINAYDGIKTSVIYDGYRRKTGLTDPSLGNIKYTYDSAGNPITETNGKGETTRYEYDAYQRLIKKTCKEFSTTYHYNAYGDVDSVCSSNGTSKKYSYDSLGRIISCKETGMNGMWLRKDLTYSKGNLSAVKYTSMFGTLTTERYSYSNGSLQEVTLANGTSIFKVEKENEFGKPTEIKTGDITRKYEFSSIGLPTKRSATSSKYSYQDVSYGFDSKTGNLMWRSDNTRGLKEYFEYDKLDRLTGYGDNTMTYDARGNVCGKSDVGTFGYSIPSRPYAITEVNTTSGSVPTSTQNISYSSFSRPVTISEEDCSISFDYNGDNDRVKMTVSSGGEFISQHHYLGGCYEIKKTPGSSYYTERLYLLGDYYSSPAMLQKLSSNMGTVNPPIGGSVKDSIQANTFSIDGVTLPPVPQFNSTSIYYILRDYLGSITHIVHSNGNLKQELSYDAWGSLRDPKTWDNYAYGEEPELFIGRGYTGHEHLVRVGLINMNARLYDPALSRFLSPDPYVQIPDWSQNLNRYTYAMNNPLVYIDEDGQFFWFVVGAAAVIGGTLNVINNWNAITSAGGWNGVWQGAKYFMVGAAAGGVSAAVGIGAAVGFGSMLGVTATGLAAASSSLSTSLFMKTAEGAVNGFMLGSMNSLIQGQDWTTALKTGAQDAAIEGVFSAATVGLQSMVPTSRNYHVYYGKDTNGDIRYVGITRQEPEVRFSQHRRSLEKDKKTPTLRSMLDYEVADIEKMYTWREARVWEQENINKYGLMKDGGQLYNKRNEIARWLWDIYGVKY